MKPSLRKISVNPLSSFNVRIDRGEKLLNNWHYHPELELLFIKNSSGTSIIGDKVESFNNSYVVLVGSNLPHTFIHENKKLHQFAEAEAFVIHFYENFLGNEFLNLPELRDIRMLLKLSKLGFRIDPKAEKPIITIMERMPDENYLERLFSLLEILKILSTNRCYSFLASDGFSYNPSDENENRINLIHNFTNKNFHRKITIEEVSSLLFLTKESFCRFFQKTTRKTYFQFLIEIRVGHACRMLVEDNISVKEVGYKCGYENISNFYHQFKNVMGKSPMQYQKDYFKFALEYQ